MDQVVKNLTLAQHFLDIGQPKRTLEILSRGGSDIFPSPHFWYLRGRALYDLEQHVEAAQTVQYGLGQYPESIPLLHLASRCQTMLGDLAAAERTILAALRQTPEDPVLLCSYALLVARAGQLDKAERLVKEATRLAPEHAYVAHTQLTLSYLHGNDKQTIQKGQELLAKEPEDVYGHYMLGSLALAQGEVEAGVRHLRTAVRLDPADPAIVEVTRRNKFASHWLLWPLRPAYRLGTIRLWVGAIVIMLALRGLGYYQAAAIFAWVYLAYCAYSWVVPPLLKWWITWRYK